MNTSKAFTSTVTGNVNTAVTVGEWSCRRSATLGTITRLALYHAGRMPRRTRSPFGRRPRQTHPPMAEPWSRWRPGNGCRSTGNGHSSVGKQPGIHCDRHEHAQHRCDLVGEWNRGGRPRSARSVSRASSPHRRYAIAGRGHDSSNVRGAPSSSAQATATLTPPPPPVAVVVTPASASVRCSGQVFTATTEARTRRSFGPSMG